MQQLHHRTLRALLAGGALLFAGAAIAEDNGDATLAKQAQCVQDAFTNYVIAKAQCDTQSSNGGQQAYCLTVAAMNFAAARDACYAQAKTGRLGVELTDVGNKPKKQGAPVGDGGNHITVPNPDFGKLPVAHVSSQGNNSGSADRVILR